MPQTIAAFIVSGIGLTGTAAVVVGAVIQLAVAWGLNALVQSLFGPEAPRPSDIQRVVRQSVGSRTRHYGVVHTGGTLLFLESKDATLHSVIVTGQGEINAILEHRLNDSIISLDGAGVVQQEKYQGRISLFSRLGAPGQTAFSELTAFFSEWDATHTITGCSAVYMINRPAKSEDFSDIYEGNREPTYTRVIQGAKVYDPRLDGSAGGAGSHRVDDSTTWEYSNNAALVIADYLAHPDGYGMGMESVNWDNIAAQAEVCDQDVTTVDDRTIKRWTVNGTYEMANAQRKAILGEMLRACDGFVWQDAEGRVNLRVGQWEEPTVHITDDHVISTVASLGTDPQASTNEVRVVYTEPRFSYTETESAAIIDAVAQARDGQEIQRYDVYYCSDHNQAVRIGKRYLRRLGERWNLTLVVNLFSLNMVGERFCRVTLEDMGIDGLFFEVTSFSMDLENGISELGLVQVTQDDFELDAATEEGTPPPLPADIEPSDAIPVPQNLSLSTIQTSSGLGISASWDENAARPDLQVEAQYRDTGVSSWLPMSVAQETRVAIAQNLNNGTQYAVRVRSVTISGLISEWSAEETITLSQVEAAPSTPSQFTSSLSGSTVQLSWRNPTEVNFSYVDVHRNTSDDFGTSTTVGGDQVGALGAPMTYDDSPGTGTFYYWLVSRTASGLSSSETASRTHTVT